MATFRHTQPDRIRRIIHVVALCVVLGALFPAHMAAEGEVTPLVADVIPSPPQDGPKPSLTITPDHGYMGQTITVGGQGDTQHASVRIALLAENATVTQAIVNLQADGNYKTELSVPTDFPQGRTQFCVAYTGTPVAEFACADFVVDTPPNGAIHGRLLGLERLQAATGATPELLDATLQLLNSTGQPVGQVPVAGDGSFAMDNVKPGVYTVAVEGTTPVWVLPTDQLIEPGRDTGLEMPSYDYDCTRSAGVSHISASINGLDARRSGIFVSGVPVDVSFTAAVQHTGLDEDQIAIEFRIRREEGPDLVWKDADGPPWQTTIDVGALPAGIHTMEITAQAPNSCPRAPLRHEIWVMANPTEAEHVYDKSMVWSGDRYEFEFRMPDISGLPYGFPLSPWPVQNLPGLNGFQTSMDLSLFFKGYLRLNGELHVNLLSARPEATIIGRQLVKPADRPLARDVTKFFPIDRDAFSESPYESRQAPSIKCSRRTIAGVDYKARIYSTKIPIYPAVNLHFQMDLTMLGSLHIEATFYPLRPAVDALMTPDLQAGLDLVGGLEVLTGLFGAYAVVNPNIGVQTPMYVRVFDESSVGLRDYCVYLWITARLELCALWRTFCGTVAREKLVTKEIPDCYEEDEEGTEVSGGGGGWSKHSPTYATTQKQKLAAATMSNDLSEQTIGDILVVYLERVRDNSPSPPRLMAEFQYSSWLPSLRVPLSDGIHTVNDPTVTFMGDHALVVWIQNTLTADDIVTPIADELAVFKDVVAHQEVVYTYWNGQKWLGPFHLTDDTVADGMPALFGTSTGASLVWTRDGDGDWTTRQDWKIAYTVWDDKDRSWSSIELLDASQGTQEIVTAHQAGLDLESSSEIGTNAYIRRVCSTCPYTTIQSAVDDADPGDTIDVAAGIYSDVHEQDALRQIVYVDKTVKIQGSYDSEATFGTYDPVAHPTILDAQGQGRVFYITGTISPTIKGFHITGGNADGLGGAGYYEAQGGDAGSGIYAIGAEPTIQENRIYSNTAGSSGSSYGIGVYLHTSTGLIHDNEIVANTGTKFEPRGGGLYLYHSPAVVAYNVISSNDAHIGGGLVVDESAAIISGNTIAHNRAAQDGGGIFLFNADGTGVYNNTISQNSAASTGGGIRFLSTANSEVQYNTLTGNESTAQGGGIWLHGSDAQIKDNEFSGNTSGVGGGIYSLSGDHATLERNIFHGNKATTGGGLAFANSRPVNLINTAIVDNETFQTGSGLFVADSELYLQHVTVHHNRGGDGVGIYADKSSYANTIEGQNLIIADQTVGVNAQESTSVTLNGVLWYDNAINTSGPGTISAAQEYSGDPAFDVDGYHLTAGSAAIDRGIASAVKDDIDEDIRPQGTAPDLGADELGAGTGVANYQVSVAQDDSGTTLAWTVDEDGDFDLTENDRYLVVAERRASGWEIERPIPLPAQSDSADILRLPSGDIVITFLVRPTTMVDGIPTGGIGRNAEVWTARRTGDHWSAQPVRDVAGEPVHGEDPALASDLTGSEVLLLFRRFGDDSTNRTWGQIALAKVDEQGVALPPIYITDDLQQHVEPALALDPDSDEVLIANVPLPVLSEIPTSAMAAALRPSALEATPLLSYQPANEELPFEVHTMASSADPACDPVLNTSQRYPGAGTSVILTMTLRNMGRDPASGLTVQFGRGTPESGQVLKTVEVSDELELGEALTVPATVVAAGGEETFYALVKTTHEDVNVANNVAAITLGELLPPDAVAVTTDDLEATSLIITWLAPPSPDVAGYRVLRGTTAGGPYELVGETTATTFQDRLLKRSQDYVYVVQTYGADGGRSAYSLETGMALPELALYLPIVVR
jgi:parallel beta-helix repeat protein